MQLHIDFSTNMLNLPVSYNSILQGFVYNTLGRADPSFSDDVHNKGRAQKINLPKCFTFGRLIGNYDYRKSKQEIIFSDHAAFEIRCTEQSFIEKFMSGCHEGEMVKLGTNFVKINKMFAENKKITESTINAFCISPFVYRAPFPECNFFDANYAAGKIINNARYKWLCAGFDASDFELDIEFADFQPKKSQPVFKNTYIIAWEIPFTLKGNARTIDFLYNTGIGKRNSQGFGMFGIK